MKKFVPIETLLVPIETLQKIPKKTLSSIARIF